MSIYTRRENHNVYVGCSKGIRPKITLVYRAHNTDTADDISKIVASGYQSAPYYLEAVVRDQDTGLIDIIWEHTSFLNSHIQLRYNIVLVFENGYIVDGRTATQENNYKTPSYDKVWENLVSICKTGSPLDDNFEADDIVDPIF